MENQFNRERVRFHIKKRNTMVIQGWFENDEKGEEQFVARLGRRLLPMEVKVNRGVEVTKKYLRYRTRVAAEYFLMPELPDRGDQNLPLKIYHLRRKDSSGAGEPTEELILTVHPRQIRQLARHLESWMDSLQERPDGRLGLRGWYIGGTDVQAAVLDGRGRVIPSECELIERTDILSEYPEISPEQAHGFELIFSRPRENFLRLAIKGGGKKALYTVNCSKILEGREGVGIVFRKGYHYLRRKGLRQFVLRVSDVLLGADGISYERWRRTYGVKPQELARQRKTSFPCEPKISIVVPLYRTPETYLWDMAASVRGQTYRNWELVLSDGSGDGCLRGALEALAASDSRIRILYGDGRQLRIAENTNEALRAVTGDWIVFGDHDDLFSPDALWSCVQRINEKPEAELIYSDEDKIDAEGRRYFEPHFKPDYDPDLLCSMNYFCHLTAVKRELFEKTGFLDPAFDGAQDYDYVLRCTEKTRPDCIEHIPRVLYHWRSHAESTAENPESKRYAFEAGCRAVQAHYDRLGLKAKVTEGDYPGLYKTEFAIQGEPLVSILIPNKDHIEDLKTCVRSIEEKAGYETYEILVIENNSTQPETFAEYERLEQEHSRLRVLYYKGGFNFSEINNFGAQHARGSYYLLLNNDTEIIADGTLRHLLGYCQREDVGAVGALLFYEDNIIQHAGVILGFGGVAGHAFIGTRRGENGYFSRILCAQDYSAVTAACMMTKASVYREVGGLSTEFRVAFNDIDYCMKVRQRGLLIVYNPQAQLYHYESKSRGLEDTPEKIERFNRETALFLERWGDQVKAGDPYYSPNLTLDKADFSLRL